jgi:2'-5' RNA ligase
MANLRLFVATDLPAEVLADISRLQARLRPAYPALRWLEPQGMHLTLKFLGAVPEERLGEIVRITAAVARGAAACDVATTGLTAFPGWRSARVVVVGCTVPPALAELQARLEPAYTSLGVAAEARAFRPHVTVARPTGRAGRLAHPGEALAEHRFRIGEIVLYQSFLGPGGSRYQALDRLPLGS